MRSTLDDALRRQPFIPALRGLSADEALAIAGLMMDQGVTVLEVPLRTKDPFKSPIDQDALRALTLLQEQMGHTAVVIAGSILRSEDVDVIQDIGVRCCFSLVCQPEVIRYAASREIDFVPGVDTVTEAIAAAASGAAALKLFPAVIREPDGTVTVRITPGYVEYLSRFLSLPLIPAGNMYTQTIASEYLRAGAAGLNVGAQVFRPDSSREELAESTKRFLSWLQ